MTTIITINLVTVSLTIHIVLCHGNDRMFQDIVSGVKHGILGRLSSVRDNSLKRVDEVQSSITNSIDTGFEALGGGSKLEDCFLQV